MTRDEFIDGYLARSGITQYRTPYGYAVSSARRVALPCICGERGCDGWAMIYTDGAEHHLDGLPEELAHPYRAEVAALKEDADV